MTEAKRDYLYLLLGWLYQTSAKNCRLFVIFKMPKRKKNVTVAVDKFCVWGENRETRLLELYFSNSSIMH